MPHPPAASRTQLEDEDLKNVLGVAASTYVAQQPYCNQGTLLRLVT